MALATAPTGTVVPVSVLVAPPAQQSTETTLVRAYEKLKSAAAPDRDWARLTIIRSGDTDKIWETVAKPLSTTEFGDMRKPVYEALMEFLFNQPTCFVVFSQNLVTALVARLSADTIYDGLAIARMHMLLTAIAGSSSTDHSYAGLSHLASMHKKRQLPRSVTERIHMGGWSGTWANHLGIEPRSIQEALARGWYEVRRNGRQVVLQWHNRSITRYEPKSNAGKQTRR